MWSGMVFIYMIQHLLRLEGIIMRKVKRSEHIKNVSDVNKVASDIKQRQMLSSYLHWMLIYLLPGEALKYGPREKCRNRMIKNEIT
jgi:hypothetical protein